MADYRIPFNKPTLVGREIEYIQRAVLDGHISGDGPFTKKAAAFFESELGIPRVLLTTSCTHALEMTALLLKIQPSDEVIVPSFTFVSTVNAFVLRGAKPVFIDIRPDTINMDETQLERLITSRTKAILPVHYAGVGCEMDTVMAVAEQYHVPVVEDNAHGLFASYKGKKLGTFGTFATLSFHETKNFICGEGGALLINDPAYIEAAEVLREKGTNRSRFFRGQVDKYTWVDVGSSYLPSDMLSAYLLAQLEQKAWVLAQRKRVFDYYAERLHDWAQHCGVQLPTIPPYCDQSYHMFYILLPSLEKRTRMIDYLKNKGILSVFHYLPLHASPMGQTWGYKPEDCPVTVDVSDRLLRLPFFNTLSEAEQEQVCQAIFEISCDW